MATSIYVIRHGETEWNTKNQLQGHLDSPLTQAGEEQTHALGTFLKGTQFDQILSSPLGRTRQTTSILLHYLPPAPVTFVDILKERSFGIFEGMTFAEIEDQFPDYAYNPSIDRYLWTPPDGENFDMVLKRIEPFVQSLPKQYPNQKVALICHGGVIRAILGAFGYIKKETWFSLYIPNTSLSVITIQDDGAVRCDPCNSAAHLQIIDSNEDVGM